MKIYTREAIRQNLIKGIGKRLGICEQLRIIYDSVYELQDSELKEKITEGLVTALIMGKKMGDRLTYYYKKTKDIGGHLGENLEPLHYSKTLKIRSKRI